MQNTNNQNQKNDQNMPSGDGRGKQNQNENQTTGNKYPDDESTPRGSNINNNETDDEM